MEKLKGLIFDLDGVIVFTDRLHYIAWKGVADKLGIYFDEKINDRLRGVSRRESLKIILERYEGNVLSEEEKKNLLEEKNNRYRELLATMSPEDVTDEVRTTLAELRLRGFKLAIGSSSKNAGFILEQTKLEKEFDAISDGNNISRSKPDPEVFLKAAEYLQLKPEECAVVEDAEAGLLGARRGGMKAVGINAAANSGLADYQLKTFGDLLSIFR